MTDNRCERARQTVEPCDHQHVAALDFGERLEKLRPVGLRARHMFAENHRATGRLQDVDLGVGRLVLGRNARVADQGHGLKL
jgi:hypothetical protein